ncbi:MAG: adenosine deaminase [Deltaproteobacteria bacterium]
MLQRPASGWLLATVLAAGCGGVPSTQDGGGDTGVTSDASDAILAPDAEEAGDATDATDAGSDGATACGTPTECGALWERNASARFVSVLGVPEDLAAFLRAVPKGGDLHNHLSGAVYAETVLDWAMTGGNCINSTTFGAVAASQCATAGNLPAPASGPFYDQILRAWSMLDFVPGAQNGHDHFFATFGKFGTVAGTHRDDSIADVLGRAAAENEVYVETMFNLGTNVGTLAASVWSGTLTAADLPAFYDMLMANAGFAAQLTRDVSAVTNAATRYSNTLGCTGASPPAACGVRVRFVAQVGRTAANDQIFGQLVSAFEMASRTPQIVAANLSSPEDDPASLRNYELHMAMLDFLYNHYTVTHLSPLHITLHAGEVVPQFLPAGYSTANTFHIRRAVEVGHAERIGHGLDILSETDAPALMDEMRDRNVLVEVCLSSNDQILEVSGTNHPLSQYLAHGVPVALATDDQGVSRSSMAGEYTRAVLDQHFDYLQLKATARNSLEHAFLPGPSLWASIATVQAVAACTPTATMAVGDETPSAECQTFLTGSERAQAQWELERRFRQFERAQ